MHSRIIAPGSRGRRPRAEDGGSVQGLRLGGGPPPQAPLDAPRQSVREAR
jgi:hypothetical protein